MSDLLERIDRALGGRYAIERELGAGGMATVFLAADVKHDRRVAIKVLKPELAAVLGAERFLVEIKTTAALQHPHILPLFDSGSANGFLFYVMPYIEGETLRAKLDRETQLGITEAVRIATDVADALDYAHRHGVVHRDVKPENILLHDGRPIVADFGIALAVSAAAGGRMTETGLSLGTPHYMSPEQATAEKDISARSDIYSLGSVLYEMLTGQPPHLGGSAQQIIMKIITEPAEPVMKHRKTVPPNVAAAVGRSLEKLPADRFETARAFADALGNPAYTSATASHASATAGTAPQGRRVIAGAVSVAIVAIAVAAWSLLAHRAASDRVVTLAFSPSSGQALGAHGQRSAVLSPDGELVVYSTSDSAGLNRLYARRLGDLQHYPIAGTENASTPFFSPDGASIGFLDGNTIRVIPVEGGKAMPIAQIAGGFTFGAAWTADGIIVSNGGTLLIVPATGGTPKPLEGASSHRLYAPVVFPGGHVIGVATSLSSASHAAVFDLTTHTLIDLGVGGAPIGVIDDQLVVVQGDGALVTIPFDARKPAVHGSPHIMIGEVTRSNSGLPKAAISADGSLVYVAAAATRQPGIVDSHGTFRALPIAADRFESARVSPDGKRAFLNLTTAGRTDVMMYDLASGAAKRMTTSGTLNGRAEWTPDGKRMLYRTDRASPNTTVWWRPIDESGDDREILAVKGVSVVEALVSPDSRFLVFRTAGVDGADIKYRSMEGDSAIKPVSATLFSEMAPRVSPDGRWIAYQTDETGATEVVVRPFPGPGASFPVSIAGGTAPMWSRDGRTLYFWNRNQFIEASVSTGTTFAVTARKTLFSADPLPGSGHAAYDVMPDGASFLMLRDVVSPHDGIVVVHNFKALLTTATRRDGR